MIYKEWQNAVVELSGRSFGEWQNVVVELSGGEDCLDYQMKNPWPLHAEFRPFFNDFNAFFHSVTPQEWVANSFPEADQ